MTEKICCTAAGIGGFTVNAQGYSSEGWGFKPQHCQVGPLILSAPGVADPVLLLRLCAAVCNVIKCIREDDQL